MKRHTPLLMFVFLAAGAAAQEAPRKANFTVSKETTYVTGPVGPDGRIDYATALNDRLGKGITPTTNFNVVVWKTFGPKPEGGDGMPAEFFRFLGIEEPPEKGEYFVDLGKFMRDQLEIEDPELREEIDAQVGRAMRRPWPAKDHPYVADWLKANPKPLDRLSEGTKRPHYFNPLTPRKENDGTSSLVSSLLPAVQKCRATATALTARAMLRLGEGKTDEARQDLLACHRLGRHLAHGATLIEGLVGIAIEAIAQRADVALLERPELTAKMLQAYRRDLQALPPMPAAADLVDLGERLSVLDVVMLVDRKGLGMIEDLAGGVPPNGVLPPGPVKDIDWDPALRKANRMFNRLAAAMRTPDRPKREEQLNRFDQELKDLKAGLIGSPEKEQAVANAFLGVGMTPAARGEVIGNVLICFLMPAVRKVQTAYDRSEQGQRNLHIAFALAAYQRDYGNYPKTLDALAPKYLDKVPDDLFTGKPLVYRPAEKGFLLYSFGPNGLDDEGRWYDDEPRGDDPSIRVPQPMK
ncbi:MAG TPA: hypothetical protein VKD90_25805 [Gemmataceae bacterium]|nr:hypothetical protein [Gemmataceae bacterium]